jgi:copper resistance protein C
VIAHVTPARSRNFGWVLAIRAHNLLEDPSMLSQRTLGRCLLGFAAFVTLVAAVSPARNPRLPFHTTLTKSEPAANDTLTTSPRALRLWFSEKVELRVTTVKLTDNAGGAVALALLARPDTGEKAPVVAGLSKPLAAGLYVVTWSTAADDGHPAKGTYRFVVRAMR